MHLAPCTSALLPGVDQEMGDEDGLRGPRFAVQGCAGAPLIQEQ